MQLNETEGMAYETSKILKSTFGDRISPTQIYDVVEDSSYRAFKIKFIAYDYFVIVFNYDVDIIGCSIEQGKDTYIPLIKGQNCFSDVVLGDYFKTVKQQIELRIPDKFLDNYLERRII